MRRRQPICVIFALLGPPPPGEPTWVGVLNEGLPSVGTVPNNTPPSACFLGKPLGPLATGSCPPSGLQKHWPSTGRTGRLPRRRATRRPSKAKCVRQELHRRPCPSPFLPQSPFLTLPFFRLPLDRLRGPHQLTSSPPRDWTFSRAGWWVPGAGAGETVVVGLRVGEGARQCSRVTRRRRTPSPPPLNPQPRQALGGHPPPYHPQPCQHLHHNPRPRGEEEAA